MGIPFGRRPVPARPAPTERPPRAWVDGASVHLGGPDYATKLRCRDDPRAAGSRELIGDRLPSIPRQTLPDRAGYGAFPVRPLTTGWTCRLHTLTDTGRWKVLDV